MRESARTLQNQQAMRRETFERLNGMSTVQGDKLIFGCAWEKVTQKKAARAENVGVRMATARALFN